MTPPSSASVGLEQGERDRDDESDDRAKVGKDIKKAQHHPDHRTELESDEAEADGVEHAHDETDDELAAKKRHDNRNEFAHEENRVGAHGWLKER